MGGIVGFIYYGGDGWHNSYNIGEIIGEKSAGITLPGFNGWKNTWFNMYWLEDCDSGYYDLTTTNENYKQSYILTSAKFKSDELINPVTQEVDGVLTEVYPETSLNYGYVEDGLTEQPFVKDENNINNGYPILYWQK